jgi:hypothetical protein
MTLARKGTYPVPPTTKKTTRKPVNVSPETIGDFVKTLEKEVATTALDKAVTRIRRRQLTIPAVEALEGMKIDGPTINATADVVLNAPMRARVQRPVPRKGGHHSKAIMSGPAVPAASFDAKKAPEKAPINGNDGRKGRVFSVRLTDDNRAAIEWLRGLLAEYVGRGASAERAKARHAAAGLALGPFLVWCAGELGHVLVAEGRDVRLVTGKQAKRAAKRGSK